MKKILTGFIKILHNPVLVLSLLFEINILQMYFSKKPLPPFSQLFIMLIVGGFIGFFLSCFIMRIVKSIFCKQRPLADESSNNDVCAIKERNLVKTIKTKVVGVTFRCALDKAYKRQEILEGVGTHSDLHLQPFTYKGAPANYVVDGDTDIGCLKSTLSETLYKKYNNCYFEVKVIDCPVCEIDDDRDDKYKEILGCLIEIKIYR